VQRPENPIPPAKTFAQLVQLIRYQKGLSQAELARALGVSRSVVAFVESSRRPLTNKDIPAWADALGVDAGKLDELRLACHGYRLEPSGDWFFFLDEFDREGYEQGLVDSLEYHVELPGDQLDLIAGLVNDLAGTSLAKSYQGQLPGRYPDFNYDGLELPPTPDGPRVWRVDLPSEPPLGDINEAASPLTEQGSLEDLHQLVGQLTDVQVALTAAFARGLIAQARSRRRPREEVPR